jgi:hypothetical protein
MPTSLQFSSVKENIIVGIKKFVVGILKELAKPQHMKQKTLLQCLSFIVAIVLLASCSSGNNTGRSPFPQSPPPFPQPEPKVIIVEQPQRRLPPGQAKKIFGGKCAKYYAKGWCKRHNRYNDYRPEAVIIIPLEYARLASNGAWYYDDNKGYRYWRGANDYFYLDSQYGNDNCFCNLSNDDDDHDWKEKKHKKEKKEKKHKHHEHDDEGDDD